jgi:hypothetical protein
VTGHPWPFCASEQPGRYGADTAAPGAVGWDGGRVRLGDLVRLHRARDLIDPAKPLDVPALARVAFMSPGHFSYSVRAAFGGAPTAT